MFEKNDEKKNPKIKFNRNQGNTDKIKWNIPDSHEKIKNKGEEEEKKLLDDSLSIWNKCDCYNGLR